MSSSCSLAAGDMKVKSVGHIDTSVPPELTCNICKELIRDAVIIPCCGESFCDECKQSIITHVQSYTVNSYIFVCSNFDS